MAASAPAPPAHPLAHAPPMSIDDVMADHLGRRRGLADALMRDFDRLFAAADPDLRNMALTATPDGAWSLADPCTRLPAPLPEPTAGVNFAREGMHPTDWAVLVAVHSDAWLTKVAFFHAAAKPLDAAERAELFRRMNELPTLLEEVRAWRGPGGGGGRPPGVRDPAPYGIPLRPALINRSLRGRAAALYWHTDDRWWMVTFVRVKPSARTAVVRYVSGEMESLNLDDVMRRKDMILLT